MSSPSPYADGGNTVPEAQGSPNVYLPQNVPPTRYDGYADPASAHGWENAYDETRELPPVGERDIPSVTGGGGPRHGAGRRAVARRPGRTVAVAGVVGAVSVAALIAGFVWPGSPSGGSGGSGGKDGRTGPTAEGFGVEASGSASPSPVVAEPAASATAGQPAADGGSPAVRPEPPSASDEGGDADRRGEGGASGGVPAEPSAGVTPAPDAPAVSPSATTGPGSSGPGGSDGRPGRGREPKRPK